VSEPLTDEMLAKLRTFELKPDDQVWMATIDRLQAALTAAQTERDEAVALAAVLQEALESDHEYLATMLQCPSTCGDCEGNCLWGSGTAALATPNEQVAALLRDAERGRQAAALDPEQEVPDEPAWMATSCCGDEAYGWRCGWSAGWKAAIIAAQGA
jgi:hypothetical protein